MKWIIEGRTYNTDTAAIVGDYSYTDDFNREVEGRLYVTPGGAFFAVLETRVREGHETRTKTSVEPLTRDDVEALTKRREGFRVIDEEALKAPPEAEAEVEPGATLYVRLPASLKKRVDAKAAAENLSANSWALRCLERCLDRPI